MVSDTKHINISKNRNLKITGISLQAGIRGKVPAGLLLAFLEVLGVPSCITVPEFEELAPQNASFGSFFCRGGSKLVPLTKSYLKSGNKA